MFCSTTCACTQAMRTAPTSKHTVVLQQLVRMLPLLPRLPAIGAASHALMQCVLVTVRQVACEAQDCWLWDFCVKHSVKVVTSVRSHTVRAAALLQCSQLGA